MNRSFSSLAPLVALSVSIALAACGGKTETASGDEGTATVPPLPTAAPSPSPTTRPNGNPPSEPSGPALPTSPHSGRVDTTDVSILYPLPAAGRGALLRATDGGSLGPLLPRSAFEKAHGGGALDFELPSAYADLALVGVRLDPCSKRGTDGGGCTAEIRAVFQGISQSKDGATVAADGGVHVVYDVSDRELGETMLEILAAKLANGDTGAEELGPHPILVAQGLDGAFATRIRAIVLRHLGEARIGRVTAFDHNFHLDGDGWSFGAVDRVNGAYVPVKVPGVAAQSQTVGGSSAHVSLAESSAFVLSEGARTDSVLALVASDRPEAGGAPTPAIASAFEAAIRIENPVTHSAESTDCANCHLAEGAHRLGASLYGLTSTNAFANGRPTTRRDERTSVTNLHAFGYLGRQVTVSQRTANESAFVAQVMYGRLLPR